MTPFKSGRVLLINSFQGYELQNYQVLEDSKAVDSLMERVINYETPIDLTLDIRPLSSKEVSGLLKFFEEYRGKLIIIINEPVISTILSRFTEIYKSPVIKPKFSYLDFHLSKQTALQVQKLQAFLGRVV